MKADNICNRIAEPELTFFFGINFFIAKCNKIAILKKGFSYVPRNEYHVKISDKLPLVIIMVNLTEVNIILVYLTMVNLAIISLNKVNITTVDLTMIDLTMIDLT